jgi:hypothetical protein
MADTAENSGAISAKRRGRPENLRPWRKGVSGNPGGRPKSIFGKAALRQLRKRAESGETILDAVVGAQVRKAIPKGDTRAAEFLRDSVDGRPGANESGSANIGQVNIVWGGPMPVWAQAQPTSQAPQTNQPILLPAWAQSKAEDDAQPQDVSLAQRTSNRGS